MRGWLSAGVWVLATGTAVGVSWLGVRSALAGGAPAAVPAVSVPATTAAATPPASGGGLSPATAPSPTTAPPSTHPTTPVTSATTTTTAATGTGQITQYSTSGGMAVLSLTSTSATLVSATPAAGYSVAVWHNTGWLRVDFTSSTATWTVLATWNGHSPSVQTYQS